MPHSFVSTSFLHFAPLLLLFSTPLSSNGFYNLLNAHIDIEIILKNEKIEEPKISALILHQIS